MGSSKALPMPICFDRHSYAYHVLHTSLLSFLRSPTHTAPHSRKIMSQPHSHPRIHCAQALTRSHGTNAQHGEHDTIMAAEATLLNELLKYTKHVEEQPDFVKSATARVMLRGFVKDAINTTSPQIHEARSRAIQALKPST